MLLLVRKQDSGALRATKAPVIEPALHFFQRTVGTARIAS